MSSPTTFLAALANETATAHLMADLALLIGPGDVVTLSGDLGAGKTAAARAMIRYLADDETLEVPSPTFTLAQSYDLPAVTLVHADLYRVNDERELEEPVGDRPDEVERPAAGHHLQVVRALPQRRSGLVEGGHRPALSRAPAGQPIRMPRNSSSLRFGSA